MEDLVTEITRRVLEELSRRQSPLIDTEHSRAVVQTRTGLLLTAALNPAHGTVPPNGHTTAREERSAICARLEGLLVLVAAAAHALHDHTVGNHPISKLITAIITDLQHDIDTARPVAAHPDRVLVDNTATAELFSARETSIFNLLIAGHSTSTMSSQLGISTHTVKHHITHIGRKLGASGRSAILQRAQEIGIIAIVPVSVIAATLTDALTP